MTDHEQLLTLLHDEDGVLETVLSGFRMYLEFCTHCVQMDYNIRDYSATEWCATELGHWPVMSILYTTTMQRIFKRHGLKYHRYTYDIVRHSSATPGDQVETARPSPHRPIGEVRRWMPLRMLKLNGEKTRTMVFASTHNV